jgi:hypothetical protein
MWLDVYEQFSELTESERLALFNAMKQDLFPDDPSKITKLLKDIREARFASGMACVHSEALLLRGMVNTKHANAIYVRTVTKHSMI